MIIMPSPPAPLPHTGEGSDRVDVVGVINRDGAVNKAVDFDRRKAWRLMMSRNILTDNKPKSPSPAHGRGE